MIGPFVSLNVTSWTWNVFFEIAFFGGSGGDGGGGGAIQENNS